MISNGLYRFCQTRKIKIVFLFLSFCCSFVRAQLLDSLALDTVHVFTDLSIALRSPEKVFKLDLHKKALASKSKKIKRFPEEIFTFPNLQYLDLSGNLIDSIPPLDKLKNLQHLDLSRNKIEEIPVSIGQLKNLKYLNINQNELTVLPPQLGELENLQHLDLWSNNIYHFPSELQNLKNLKILDLRVILIDDAVQSRIHEWLPNTRVFFSPNCKCKS